MSMDVTQLRGYDASLYEGLKDAVEASDGIKGRMVFYDQRVISLVNAGVSFADAVEQVKSEIPALTAPSNMQSMSPDILLKCSQAAFYNVKALISLMGSAQGQEGLNMVNGLGQELSDVLRNEPFTQEELQGYLDHPMYA